MVTEDKTVEASKNTEVKAGSIAIDEAHFPDKVFREQIMQNLIKTAIVCYLLMKYQKPNS